MKQKLTFVNCKICNRNFKQVNALQFLCRHECRKIYNRQKYALNKKPTNKVQDVNHPFRTCSIGRAKTINKKILREHIKKETEKFLETNKITVLPNSPNGKVASVRTFERGHFSDAHEFYSMLEELDAIENNNITHL